MPLKVLAIDEDSATSELLGILLKANEFDVHTVTNITAGITYLRRYPIDIVLLDLITPQQQAWQTCSAIRMFSNVPIIVLSALNDPSVVASALDAGADDYLVKPVPGKILIAHMRTLARRSLPAQRAYLPVADLQGEPLVS